MSTEKIREIINKIEATHVRILKENDEGDAIVINGSITSLVTGHNMMGLGIRKFIYKYGFRYGDMVSVTVKKGSNPVVLNYKKEVDRESEIRIPIVDPLVPIKEGDQVQIIIKPLHYRAQRHYWRGGFVPTEFLKLDLVSVMKNILKASQAGNDVSKEIADELGFHSENVKHSYDNEIHRAYNMVRNSANSDPTTQANALKSAIAILEKN